MGPDWGLDPTLKDNSWMSHVRVLYVIEIGNMFAVFQNNRIKKSVSLTPNLRSH